MHSTEPPTPSSNCDGGRGDREGNTAQVWRRTGVGDAPAAQILFDPGERGSYLIHLLDDLAPDLGQRDIGDLEDDPVSDDMLGE